ncbi:MAG TPA: YidC/Oxa1 family membrane protein insertase [Ktedonobacterales bacterium]
MPSFLQFLQPIGDLFHTLFYLPIFNILMLIYSGLSHIWFGGAFALAIIILTLLMRVCLIPLVRKQLRSQRTMQELQPKIAQLKRQYAGDQQGMLAAQQALFKEHGYSPVSGCLPLLIQMPFLYALYYALFAVLNKATPHETVAHHLARINHDIYPFLPSIHVMPQTWFIWTNLADKDPTYILPVLAALFTFIQLRMAMPVRKKVPGQQKDATSQATQFTQYLMPVMTLIFGLSFPAGLPLYWSVSTGFSAVQQYFISGFGSLFVGLDRFFPSLARFIPEPKETPALATSAATRGGGGAAVRSGAARAAIAAPPSSGGGGGGFLGMIKAAFTQATEQAQQQTQERQSERAGRGAGAKNTKIVEGSLAADSSASENAAPANGRAASPTSSATRSRRPRADRSGPMLVRPSASTSAPSSTRGAELPEKALAREATGLPPEIAAANGLSTEPGANGNSNGTGTGPGTSAKNYGKGPGVSATRGAPGGTTRATPGSGRPQTGKGPNAARRRGNRPKGSR